MVRQVLAYAPISVSEAFIRGGIFFSVPSGAADPSHVAIATKQSELRHQVDELLANEGYFDEEEDDDTQKSPLPPSLAKFTVGDMSLAVSLSMSASDPLIALAAAKHGLYHTAVECLGFARVAGALQAHDHGHGDGVRQSIAQRWANSGVSLYMSCKFHFPDLEKFQQFVIFDDILPAAGGYELPPLHMSNMLGAIGVSSPALAAVLKADTCTLFNGKTATNKSTTDCGSSGSILTPSLRGLCALLHGDVTVNATALSGLNLDQCDFCTRHALNDEPIDLYTHSHASTGPSGANTGVDSDVDPISAFLSQHPSAAGANTPAHLRSVDAAEFTGQPIPATLSAQFPAQTVPSGPIPEAAQLMAYEDGALEVHPPFFDDDMGDLACRLDANMYKKLLTQITPHAKTAWGPFNAAAYIATFAVARRDHATVSSSAPSPIIGSEPAKLSAAAALREHMAANTATLPEVTAAELKVLLAHGMAVSNNEAGRMLRRIAGLGVSPVLMRHHHYGLTAVLLSHAWGAGVVEVCESLLLQGRMLDGEVLALLYARGSKAWAVGVARQAAMMQSLEVDLNATAKAFQQGQFKPLLRSDAVIQQVEGAWENTRLAVIRMSGVGEEVAQAYTAQEGQIMMQVRRALSLGADRATMMSWAGESFLQLLTAAKHKEEALGDAGAAEGTCVMTGVDPKTVFALGLCNLPESTLVDASAAAFHRPRRPHTGRPPRPPQAPPPHASRPLGPSLGPRVPPHPPPRLRRGPGPALGDDVVAALAPPDDHGRRRLRCAAGRPPHGGHHAARPGRPRRYQAQPRVILAPRRPRPPLRSGSIQIVCQLRCKPPDLPCGRRAPAALRCRGARQHGVHQQGPHVPLDSPRRALHHAIRRHRITHRDPRRHRRSQATRPSDRASG
jgi:hypothetical protein